MGNNYAMGQVSYTQTLPNMKNILSSWLHIARTTPVPPYGGLSLAQENANEKRVSLTNNSGCGREGGRYQKTDIPHIKFYNCNHYGH